MANHKSAIKRARQNKIHQVRNKTVKTRTKNVVKSVRLAVEQNDSDLAVKQLNLAKSLLAKAAKRAQSTVVHGHRLAPGQARQAHGDEEKHDCADWVEVHRRV